MTTTTEWISILKCPITGSDLRLLEKNEITALNQKPLWQVDGTPMREPITNGLTTTDGEFIYPIIKDIVLLLKDLAVVDNKKRISAAALDADKKLVRDFYDKKGWHINEKGDYADADIFEDLRPISSEYIRKCHSRVSRYLKPSGKYLLDAASGALQFQDYLQYSANYEYRVCVDLSFQGLLECKRKLGNRAICLLCDITNLPVKDGKIDSFISLNTIYHIPRDEQVKAITELWRVLVPQGKGVVVYDWYKHSPWMNISLLPFRAIEFVKGRVRKVFTKVTGKETSMLYFHAHPYEYFREKVPVPFKLGVWRSLSVPFMKLYIHPWLFGRNILEWIYEREEKNPEKYGLKGEYPLFAFEKHTDNALSSSVTDTQPMQIAS